MCQVHLGGLDAGVTETTIGSQGHVIFLNYGSRRKTFINSPKGAVEPNGLWSIERAGIAIEIVPTVEGKFRFNLDEVKGQADYSTLLDAQIKVFGYVKSGDAATYLAERRQKIAERNAKAKTRPTLPLPWPGRDATVKERGNRRARRE